MGYRGIDTEAEYLRRLQGAAEDHARGAASFEESARIWRVDPDDLFEHEEAIADASDDPGDCNVSKL